MTRITHDVRRIPYTNRLETTPRDPYAPRLDCNCPPIETLVSGKSALAVALARQRVDAGDTVVVLTTDPSRFEVAGLVMTKVGDGEYRVTLPRGSK